MRILIALAAASLVVGGCGGEADRQDITKIGGTRPKADAGVAVGVPAVASKRLDFASCFAEDIADEAAKSSRCPSFALLSLDYMGKECSAVGGTLKPLPQSVSWSLDVDGDASAEVLVDLAANIDCEGAPGVFSCGSLGCPYLLYKKRGDTWAELGDINADDAPSIEVLPAEEGKYSTLRGGCTGLRPCSELTHYEWSGTRYERTWIDVRGNPVDIGSGELMTLTEDTSVLDGPKKNGQPLEQYPVGTVVQVIGTARDAPYSFVSPCNACRRGFVETALLAPR